MTFTAPTTYTEAKALMGKTLETPLGALECTSAGLAGVEGTGRETFSLHFHQLQGHQMNVVISWYNTTGWITEVEASAGRWTESWDKLPANARKLIDLMIGTDLEAIPVERRSKVDKLLRIAKRRMIKAGKLALKTCGRCAGSGKYSYCQTHGDTCFGCGGTGKVLPTTSEALKAARK